MGWLENLIGTGYGANRGFKIADGIREYGDSLWNYKDGKQGGAMHDLGNSLAADSAFKGYGVSTGLGSGGVTMGSDGRMNVSLGVGQNQTQNHFASTNMKYADTMAQQAMQDPYARQADLYQQAMNVQNPMLDQMQAQQQARSYASGRGGVRGSQFGGSAEDAAMARARVQGSNQAYMQAQQMGMAEQAQQGQMAGMFNQMGQSGYQTSFLPMQQQMQMMQLAGQDADRYQTGQLTGQGYRGQTALGGIQAAVNAQKAASELEGNVIDSIFDNASGLFDLF